MMKGRTVNTKAEKALYDMVVPRPTYTSETW